jgi:CheY-like chemotaxis protein
MGTTISLYLPAIVKKLSNANADPHDSETAPIDSMLILVAEDDTLVMKLTVRRLQRMGHQVLQAGDGHTALELFKQFPDIDLVFSDVVMAGGMSGYDLANAIRAIDPKKRILLTSGYAENIVNATKLAQVGLSLLRKPYRQQDLVDAIKAICSDK